METYKKLLNEIDQLCKELAVKREEATKRGEFFNVFSVLNLQRREVRLHSSFLAELLDPHGSHGCGSLFLEAFCRVVLNEEGVIDISSIVVRTEMNIGTIDMQYEHGGQIDIVLYDKNKHAIIIENKIDAGDQKKQLKRYNNYAKEKYSDYRILYLTKEGREASESSTDGEVKYKSISYAGHIIDWMKKCEEIAAEKPPVRETIHQYIINLYEILDIMNEEEKNELVALAANENNINASLELIKIRNEIFTTVRRHFCESLKVLAKSKGYEFESDDNLIKYGGGDNLWLSFKKPELSETWGLYIGTELSRDGVFYGISSNCGYELMTEDKLEGLERVWEYTNTPEFPFGTDYLRSEAKDWRNWNDEDTLQDMANGTILKFVSDLLDFIEEKHLIETLEKLK